MKLSTLYKSVFTILILTVSSTFANTKNLDLITELSNKVKNRKLYYAKREAIIDHRKMELYSNASTYKDRYALMMEISSLYSSFQSDSSLLYANKALKIANTLADNDLTVRTQAQILMNYSLNGRFLDAEGVLRSIKDTINISRKTKFALYASLHRQYRELSKCTASEDEDSTARKLYNYYATRALENHIDNSSRLYYSYQIALNNEEFDAAMALCDSVVTIYPQNAHIYAQAAYHKYFLLDKMGADSLKMDWLIKSAISDIECAIRDYGSLGLVAKHLFDRGDVSKAMSFISASIVDHAALNSLSRSWLDTAILPKIELAYRERNDKLKVMYITLIAVLFLLTIVTTTTVMLARRQHDSMRKIQNTLKESNKELDRLTSYLKIVNKDLNRQNMEIADSNRIKEVYIGNFFKVISEYINKLESNYRYVSKMLRNGKIEALKKEYSRSNIRNEELKEFYKLFDSTFLHLYPTFVEEFEELLNDTAESEKKESEILTTEQRIYALIRLSITSNSTIATLLHCSINTVYSYRSRARLRVKSIDEDLDKQVMMIGLTNKKHI